MNDDYTPEEWAQIQANAKHALRMNPKNANAREALKAANVFLASQRQAASTADSADVAQSRREAHGVISGASAGAAQTVMGGLADEYLGALKAVRDPRTPLTREAIGAEIAAERERLNQARAENPGPAALGSIAGFAVNPVTRILGPLTQGLGLAAKGATYGGVLGGLQGLGEGEPGQRTLSGAGGALLGGAFGLAGGGAGALGAKAAKPLAQMGRNLQSGVIQPLLTYAGGKVPKPLVQIWQGLKSAFRATEKQVSKSLPPTTAPEAIQTAKEAAHRAYLTKQGYPPEAIERLMETWRAGSKLPANPPVMNPPVETPVRTRPGETLIQKVPQGPDALRNLSEAELAAAHPMGVSPPLAQSNAAPGVVESQIAAAMPRTMARGTPSPHDPRGAARSAHALAEAAGLADPTAAARGAAGTYSNFDPRQALLLSLLLGGGQAQR